MDGRKSTTTKSPNKISLPNGLGADAATIGQEALRIHESALYSAQSQS